MFEPDCQQLYALRPNRTDGASSERNSPAETLLLAVGASPMCFSGSESHSVLCQTNARRIADSRKKLLPSGLAGSWAYEFLKILDSVLHLFGLSLEIGDLLCFSFELLCELIYLALSILCFRSCFIFSFEQLIARCGE